MANLVTKGAWCAGGSALDESKGAKHAKGAFIAQKYAEKNMLTIIGNSVIIS